MMRYAIYMEHNSYRQLEYTRDKQLIDVDQNDSTDESTMDMTKSVSFHSIEDFVHHHMRRHIKSLLHNSGEKEEKLRHGG